MKKTIWTFFLCGLCHISAVANTYDLGMQFYNNKNYSNALYLLESAADDGDERAYKIVGELAYQRKDYELAQKYLLKEEEFLQRSPKVSQQDRDEVHTYLALLYQYGLPDFKKSFDWYAKIPQENLTSDNKYHMAIMLMVGDTTLDKNTDEGEKRLKELNFPTYAQSLYDVAQIYESGQEVEKDNKMAIYYYEKSLKEAEAESEGGLVLKDTSKIADLTHSNQKNKDMEKIAKEGLNLTDENSHSDVKKPLQPLIEENNQSTMDNLKNLIMGVIIAGMVIIALVKLIFNIKKKGK